MYRTRVKVFKAWEESGETAIALCEGNWFLQAINCMRDGDMGEKGDDGIYSRIWAGDELWGENFSTLRNASEEEVNLWLKHCSLENEGGMCIEIRTEEGMTKAIFIDTAVKSHISQRDIDFEMTWNYFDAVLKKLGHKSGTRMQILREYQRRLIKHFEE